MASTQADQLEALVLTLWRRRGEAAAVAETTSQLQSMLKDPAALDAVEFYLPQFAHMLIQLGGASGDTWCRRSACAVAAGPPRCTLAAAKACLGPSPDAHPGDVIEGSAELEKFVLAVCQMSVHFALQFFWIVYASLQEHCPKKAGSKRGIYTRHATATATATAQNVGNQSRCLKCELRLQSRLLSGLLVQAPKFLALLLRQESLLCLVSGLLVLCIDLRNKLHGLLAGCL